MVNWPTGVLNINTLRSFIYNNPRNYTASQLNELIGEEIIWTEHQIKVYKEKISKPGISHISSNAHELIALYDRHKMLAKCVMRTF